MSLVNRNVSGMKKIKNKNVAKNGLWFSIMIFKNVKYKIFNCWIRIKFDPDAQQPSHLILPIFYSFWWTTDISINILTAESLTDKTKSIKVVTNNIGGWCGINISNSALGWEELLNLSINFLLYILIVRVLKRSASIILRFFRWNWQNALLQIHCRSSRLLCYFGCVRYIC
jgi:hypothetical protein